MPNRLANESSPYLLQHARNPVDWYPWGNEALNRAKEENKPIFLSIGYSACHWCHVMERESFEDLEIARILNSSFIPIKVDREERPDLDAIYMKAVVGMTGRGGWPMSVWLTPEGQPFYGGSYFPPSPRFGMPGFKQVLNTIADMWRSREDQLRESAESITRTLSEDEAAKPGRATARGRAAGAGPGADLEGARETLRRAGGWLVSSLDRDNGGWGTAPKFPQPMVIDFLLHRYALAGDAACLEAALWSLESMAAGGIYDQVGGGFHRYSTDENWTVPHFEKMLYDNAQLARVYLHAHRLTGDGEFRRVAEETIDFVLLEMTHPAGGFFSTLDADSEGEEGKYYVWEWNEVQQVCGNRPGEVHLASDGLPDGVDIFTSVYSFTPRGNFEGRNIPRLAGRLDKAIERVATARGLPVEEVSAAIGRVRGCLLAARAERVRPDRDEKILASWNGLMLAALAEAGAALDRPDYLAAARKNADFLLTQMRRPDGRLSHSKLHGAPRPEVFLEDYAFVIEGLLALYQADFDERWFVAARELADQMLLHFAAPQGGFFDTPEDHEQLIARPQELQDNALPCGNSAAATALPRLTALTADERYRDAAEGAFAIVGNLPATYPVAFGQWLVALQLETEPRVELAIVGPPESQRTRALVASARNGFHPNAVTAFAPAEADSVVPLLAGRLPGADEEAAAWLCRGFTCLPPVSDARQLEQLLADKGRMGAR